MATKNDRWYRLILNLKNLNENIEHIYFKIQGLKEILKMVQKNCFMYNNNKKFIKIKKPAQVIGKIVAALPGPKFGALYYRGLE